MNKQTDRQTDESQCNDTRTHIQETRRLRQHNDALVSFRLPQHSVTMLCTPTQTKMDREAASGRRSTPGRSQDRWKELPYADSNSDVSVRQVKDTLANEKKKMCAISLSHLPRGEKSSLGFQTMHEKGLRFNRKKRMNKTRGGRLRQLQLQEATLATRDQRCTQPSPLHVFSLFSPPPCSPVSLFFLRSLRLLVRHLRLPADFSPLFLLVTSPSSRLRYRKSFCGNSCSFRR